MGKLSRAGWGEGAGGTEAKGPAQEEGTLDALSGALRTSIERSRQKRVCRDVSVRRLDKIAQRGRDEAFRQLTEHIHEVFWLTDLADNRVLYVSPMYETVWGRSAERLLENAHAWTDAIHAEDRARVIEAWERDALRGEFDEVYRIVRPDGTVRWIHDRGFPIRNEDGEVYRLAGLAEDITDRRRVEEALRLSGEQLRSIAESSADYIMMLDSEARIVFINRTLPDVSPAEAIGTAVYDWVAPRFWPTMKACFDEVLATGRDGVYTVEYEAADGSLRTFESRVGPVMREGRVQALVVNSRDITHRLNLEAEIRDSHARLERLTERLYAIREDERAEIAREIHDQLGQGLTGLRLDIAWILDRVGSGDEALSERLRHSLEVLDRTLGSVRDLAIKLRPACLDDLGLDAAVEAFVRDRCSRARIECSVRGGVNGYPVSREQATATYRIMQEAVTNVIRHADARRVDIRLGGGGGTLLMEVRDDGIGITDEQVVSRDSVGLTGMRERARACGGTLTIGRPDEGGTSVQLRLPLEPSGA
jgi:PAS domain S-box-containing protein